MEPIITVKGISKKYNINHQQGGYIALRDIITNAFKNPFSFLKTKTKEILGVETKEIFWALKDINFEVNKGEVIGIIGRNGAGKSTLLKILSQITPPTTGEIRINGTVGSLLEVGTGFHPELTGRENIFLNGSILGMKKKDIIRKFDEIVKFADIEKFLDTPVKYYSSGMYVRLAFSVAAHMETDILIIDEVLAVGDAEFQKKCLGKMNDITKEEERTILFVSHNMEAVEQLCKKCILLKDGQISKIGETDKIIESYQESSTDKKREINMRSFQGPFSKFIKIKDIFINDEKMGKNILQYNPLVFKVSGSSIQDIENFQLTFSIYYNDVRLFTLFDKISPSILKKGNFVSSFKIDKNNLRPGVYSVAIGGETSSDNRWFYGTQLVTFNIIEKFNDSNDTRSIGIMNIEYNSERIQ